MCSDAVTCSASQPKGLKPELFSFDFPLFGKKNGVIASLIESFQSPFASCSCASDAAKTGTTITPPTRDLPWQRTAAINRSSLQWLHGRRRKCSRQLKREAEHLQAQVHEAERRISLASEKTTRDLNQDVADIVSILEDQDRVCANLQATLKHQHRHIQDLQTSYQQLSLEYNQALNTLSSLEVKANQLSHEIDAVRRNSS